MTEITLNKAQLLSLIKLLEQAQEHHPDKKLAVSLEQAGSGVGVKVVIVRD